MSVASASGTASRVRIKTAHVTGRRVLHFTTLHAILEEAERLRAAQQIVVLGNWTLGQTLSHLARAMDMAIDGARFRLPWYIRLFTPLVRKRVLFKSMPPGLQLPADAARQLVPPPTTSTEQGLADLCRAIHRLQTTPQRAKSPVFGRMSRDEGEQFHLRHAELHLSFFVPA